MSVRYEETMKIGFVLLPSSHAYYHKSLCVKLLCKFQLGSFDAFLNLLVLHGVRGQSEQAIVHRSRPLSEAAGVHAWEMSGKGATDSFAVRVFHTLLCLELPPYEPHFQRRIWWILPA
jgi:hypothetical protein